MISLLGYCRMKNKICPVCRGKGALWMAKYLWQCDSVTHTTQVHARRFQLRHTLPCLMMKGNETEIINASACLGPRGGCSSFTREAQTLLLLLSHLEQLCRRNPKCSEEKPKDRISPACLSPDHRPDGRAWSTREASRSHPHQMPAWIPKPTETVCI